MELLKSWAEEECTFGNGFVYIGAVNCRVPRFIDDDLFWQIGAIVAPVDEFTSERLIYDYINMDITE